MKPKNKFKVNDKIIIKLKSKILYELEKLTILAIKTDEYIIETLEGTRGAFVCQYIDNLYIIDNTDKINKQFDKDLKRLLK